MHPQLDQAVPSDPPRPRVAILGGGMAGMAAAWRLSEPGWTERFSSVTVYQRGWRLGGKGASSRGAHGRIEEHGLHVWLGHYDNAFRLIRDCYGELDRAHRDPAAPIRTWRDAFLPSSEVGMEDLHEGAWSHWVAHFAENDLTPGDPDDALRSAEPAVLVRRCAELLRDFVESFDLAEPAAHLSASSEASPAARRRASPPAAAVLAAGAMVEGLALASEPIAGRAGAEAVRALDVALAEVRGLLASTSDADHGARQAWHLVGVIAAVVRGTLADGVLEDPLGFRSLNDEEFCDWIRRHGATEETTRSTYVRGLYDLCFAHVDGDPERRAFGAGVGAFISVRTLLDYKGAFFWKMAAGMGDVVFAPLYEALRARGVEFEFFHRVDALHVSPDDRTIEAITLGQQVRLAPGHDRYEPLVRVRGLPCFPDRPLVAQLDADAAVANEPLESIWCAWPDAGARVLRQGVDFDQVVFAIPPSMAAEVCTELLEHRVEWRAMVDNLATVATQAFQLWLREPEPALGWARPGTTITGFVDGFDTWASMPQLIAVEDWPAGQEPGSIAYFCNTLASHGPQGRSWAEHAAAAADRVRETAKRFCSTDLGHLLPGAVGPDGFRWELLCGAGDRTGPAAFDSQFWRANVDPSDRYVQSVPGSDRYRLRADESGYDNLVLAGDWTDNGLNAGCIEAAVLSGLQAANALLGRHRWHRIIGAWLP